MQINKNVSFYSIKKEKALYVTLESTGRKTQEIQLKNLFQSISADFSRFYGKQGNTTPKMSIPSI